MFGEDKNEAIIIIDVSGGFNCTVPVHLILCVSLYRCLLTLLVNKKKTFSNSYHYSVYQTSHYQECYMYV